MYYFYSLFSYFLCLLYQHFLFAAMVLTGVHEQEGQVSKWRIENSWGKDSGHDGFITMTTEWFKEWVFEIVVDKSHCPKEVLDAFQTTPTVLPAWDPMGSLALSE